jgi:cytochrome c oxidase cbb3-type subunit IV
MDVNDMRVVLMLLGLVLFLGIWAWTWSSRRKAAFDEAARLPFLDDEPGAGASSSPGRPKTTTPPRGAGAVGALGAKHGEPR